ncbi:MAG: amino acid ABC transporter permease [Lachnospiraceae bacterium]|nr:amino acid ABC transporter permease [Lachnospiraceae bacterium]
MTEWIARVEKMFVAAFITKDRWKLYLDGLGVTLKIAFFAAILGMVIGTVLALMKLSTRRDGKKSVLTVIANLYIDVIRGTPSVLQLLIMWFLIMSNSKNGVLVAVLSFGINSGAYVAEIVRAGILAVDNGQMEAGRSLGLSKAQTMMYIVLPQAVKNVLPPIGNEFIVLLKETAIVGYVSLTDLTRVANQIASRTYEAFMPLIGAAVIYFVVIKILTILLAQLERGLRKGDNR